MDDTQVETKELAKPKKLDAVGITYYGEKFVGYMRIGEVADMIPQFKDFYYQKRIADSNARLLEIVQAFNNEVAYPQDKLFHPYTNQLRGWAAKWNADIMRQKLQMRDEKSITPEKEIRQIVKVRTEERGLMAPSDSDLEQGVRTLGGELLNDAMQMLREDQELEEAIDDEVLMKRRNYIVGVFAHTTRLVHGKAALMLKASEEKRNNTSFMMTLLAKATSGKLTEEEMTMLETTYSPPTPSEPQQRTQL